MSEHNNCHPDNPCWPDCSVDANESELLAEIKQLRHDRDGARIVLRETKAELKNARHHAWEELLGEWQSEFDKAGVDVENDLPQTWEPVSDPWGARAARMVIALMKERDALNIRLETATASEQQRIQEADALAKEKLRLCAGSECDGLKDARAALRLARVAVIGLVGRVEVLTESPNRRQALDLGAKALAAIEKVLGDK